MAGPVAISVSDVVAQLRALGVEEGDVLLVHSSFRAARPVEGGPEGLIAALSRSVGKAGTLVMPSWTGDDENPFCAETTPVAADLGIVPELFRRMPGVERSRHPFAFAASGPHAARILADPLPLPPHRLESPVGRVLEWGGKILLLGVGHDANSTLHLTEFLARVPYKLAKHITVLRDGKPARIDYFENDHCCERFNDAGLWLAEKGLQTDGLVGHAASKLMRSRDVVDLALPRLAEDPCRFLHPLEADCGECRLAWRSVA